MKKKILITSVHLDVGGIETALLNFLNLIDYTKYDVDLVLYKKMGVNLKNIPKEVSVFSPYQYKNCVKLLNKVTLKDKLINKIIRKLTFNKFNYKIFIKKHAFYDVGIAFAGYHYLMDSFVANSNCKKKYIWVHTDVKYLVEHDENYKKKFYKTKEKYDKFDKIIAVSKSALETFSLILPKYKEKMEYIWNILTTNILPGCVKLSNKYNIISIGRLEKQKGYDRLIDVAKILLKENKNFHIYVLGNGTQKKELLNSAEEKKLTNYISFLGTKENVYEYLNSADLFVSTSYSEGLGMVITEAFLCHVPVVVPKVTGIVDVAKEMAPKNSFILTNNDIESIKNGIIKAMRGKINKNFNFDSEEINKKITKKYNDVLKGII